MEIIIDILSSFAYGAIAGAIFMTMVYYKKLKKEKFEKEFKEEDKNEKN